MGFLTCRMSRTSRTLGEVVIGITLMHLVLTQEKP